MSPGRTREARQAHNAVWAAIYAGALKQVLLCEQCGGDRYGIDAHHDDYAKPLDVRWLCRSCHIKHHVALRKAAGTYIHNGGKASRWKAAHALRKAAPKSKKRRAA